MTRLKKSLMAAGACVALLSIGLFTRVSAPSAQNNPQSSFNLNDTWPLSWGIKSTGIYGSSVSNWFRIYTNGSDQFAVTSAGLVGVGTDTPVSHLDVAGNVSIGSYAGVNAAPTNGVIVSGILAAGTAAPQASNAFEVGSTSAVRVKNNGWIEYHQTLGPSISSCGTNPAAVTTGADMAGDVVTGTANSSSCTLTFAEAPTNIPHCFCNDRSRATATCQVTPTATTITLAGSVATTWSANDIIDWVCLGHQ